MATRIETLGSCGITMGSTGVKHVTRTHVWSSLQPYCLSYSPRVFVDNNSFVRTEQLTSAACSFRVGTPSRYSNSLRWLAGWHREYEENYAYELGRARPSRGRRLGVAETP